MGSVNKGNDERLSAEDVHQLHVRLVGGLEVSLGNSVLPISGDRQRRLLARLALSKGATVSRSRIADALWANGDMPEDPDSGVRTYVGRLRGMLGHEADAVETADGGYRLADRVTTDLARFNDCLGNSRLLIDEGDHQAALEELTRALQLSSGALLDSWSGEAWVVAEAARLEESRLTASQEYAAMAMELGRVSDAIEALSPLNASQPHHEGVARSLAAALHSDGRSADALSVLAECRRRLATDLGLEPSPDLSALESRILNHKSGSGGSAGRSVRSYDLLERIGEGSFSVVYRGLQPTVEREVAIKVIRSELANDQDFVRRFEAEAMLVARLEHPSIVPLYDFWREPDVAYLIMRWLRGGTLRSRLIDRSLSPEESVELVEQVGDALALAHSRGVVHRDVKPDNVFLDESGRYYLGDFGIAVDAQVGPDPVAALSIGSPAYASPEQLSRQPVGPATDVYGLAITAYEALAGSVPFQEAASQAEMTKRKLSDPIPSLSAVVPGLPAGLDEVIERATRKDPQQRTDDVGEFVVAYREALSDSPSGSVAPVGSMTLVPGVAQCPYVGLAAFDEADADHFFGRDRLVLQLVDRLRDARMLTVVGPSGSGKSSLVRAGLVPAVRRGAMPGSEAWFVTTMTPGVDPFEELEAALLRVAVNPPVSLREQLIADDRGIARAIRRILPDAEAEILLVLDQFEELFTLCPDEGVRRAFLRGLVAAVTDERSHMRVVATCRADFFDHPLRHPELAQLLRDNTIPITPLAPDELERVIVDPAAQVGVEFEPGLVSAIVAEVNDQPGALPLLQFTLTRLWDTQVSGLLTVAEYQSLGGVAGALAAEAESLYETLPHDQRTVARRLFRGLVNPGEGHADTRRRADRVDLEDSAESKAVIEAFGAARLLAFDKDRETRRPTVEVAHEALLREWPRLGSWIDEDREGIRVHRHLAAAARAWDESGRDASELYRGGRLDSALEFRSTAPLSDLEVSFLEAGEAERDREFAAEKRRLTRLRTLLGAVAAVAVVAVVAGFLAVIQQRRADRESAEAQRARDVAAAEATRANQETERAEAALTDAETVTMISRSNALVTENPAVSLLLAVEAYKREESNRAAGALLTALGEHGSVTRNTDLPSVPETRCEQGAASRDGYDYTSDDGWAIYGQGDSVFGVDPSTGRSVKLADRPDPCARVLVSWLDGPILYQTGEKVFMQPPTDRDNNIELLSVAQPAALAASSGNDPVAAVVTAPVEGADLYLYDANGASIASPVESELFLRDVYFSRSGDSALALEQRSNSLERARVQLIAARTGAVRWTVEESGAALLATFSPDEGHVATVNESGTVNVYTVEGGEIVDTFRSSEGSSTSIAFVDRSTIAVATGSGIELRNIGTQQSSGEFAVSGAKDVRALGEGEVAVVTNDSGSLTVIDSQASGMAKSLSSVEEGQRVYLSGGGIAGIADLSTNTAELVDLVNGERRTAQFAVDGAGIGVAITPSDRISRYLVFTVDGVLGEFVDGEVAEALQLFDDRVHGIQSGAGHSDVAALHFVDRLDASGVGVAFLVDLARLEVVVGPIETNGCVCSGVYPTPDGEGVVVEEEGVLFIDDGSGRRELVRGLAGAEQPVYAADAAKNLLVRGTESGVVELIDMVNGSADVLDEFGSQVSGLTVLENGKIAVSLADGGIWLLDTEGGDRVGKLWDGGAFVANAGTPVMSPDGSTLWAASKTEIVALPLHADDWIDRACTLAGRDLTETEWSELMPGDEAYRPTCTESSAG